MFRSRSQLFEKENNPVRADVTMRNGLDSARPEEEFKRAQSFAAIHRECSEEVDARIPDTANGNDRL
jgi:hypothetical protein